MLPKAFLKKKFRVTDMSTFVNEWNYVTSSVKKKKAHRALVFPKRASSSGVNYSFKR